MLSVSDWVGGAGPAMVRAVRMLKIFHILLIVVTMGVDILLLAKEFPGESRILSRGIAL